MKSDTQAYVYTDTLLYKRPLFSHDFLFIQHGVRARLSMEKSVLQFLKKAIHEHLSLKMCER